jgi:drug/metabolite transporter (DMT)-like permease
MAETAKTSNPDSIEPDPVERESAPPRADRTVPLWRQAGLPRWLTLSLMSAFFLLVAGFFWAIANAQSACGFLDDAPADSIMPYPQPCGPDATTPALVTIWLIAILLAAAFVVAFTLEQRRGRVLLIIAGVMLLGAVFGGIATAVAASSVPPIIYY